MFLRFLVALALASPALYAQSPLEATHLEVSAYEDAVKIAQEQGRWIYIVFRDEGCVWCERQEVDMSNPRATEAMDGLVVCFVDIKERKDLRSKYGVRMIPAHRLLDSNGRVVRSAAGYLDSSKFERFLAR